MTCEKSQVVVVPFPFSEGPGQKKRPALVISNRTFNRTGWTVLAMITTAAHNPWPGDTRVLDLKAAGLQMDCVVRLKLFTLDNRLILRRLGQLGEADHSRFDNSLRVHLS